jgi:hypothetical protein
MTFVLVQQTIINDMSRTNSYNYDKITSDLSFKGGLFQIICE